ncbi:MAG: acylneuraminate cytidylyltransferase family protein [Burkholderiales bacterium]|nr:acylneuraminate cytidylyltransferase family protein [Phycisphaerae bacterium]
MRPTVAAIIPMRHDSKRVPGKNWRPLGGRPLFCHIVDSLRMSGMIDRIVIDTDSDAIRAIASKEFPDAILIDRPQHLRDDMLPMNDVLLHTTSCAAADIYLQTHSTNPLLHPDTITAAVKRFMDARGQHDSLFSVTRLQQRLWDRFSRPVNHNPAVLERTQDLPPLYFENSCFYIFTRASLEKFRNRIGGSPIMFEVDRIEAWDIDEEADFTIAEMLYQTVRQRRSAA